MVNAKRRLRRIVCGMNGDHMDGHKAAETSIIVSIKSESISKSGKSEKSSNHLRLKKELL